MYREHGRRGGGQPCQVSTIIEQAMRACDTGTYEGQFGIFVTGGTYGGPQPSVEFYVALEQRWTVLSSMTTARAYHSLGYLMLL